VVVDGVGDEVPQGGLQAAGVDGGAGLAVLGGLDGGRSAAALLNSAADVDDPGVEVDVAGLEGDQFTPPQPGPGDQAHGQRPPGMPVLFQGGEQGVALVVGGQG
jgi:hypothetical protein